MRYVRMGWSEHFDGKSVRWWASPALIKGISVMPYARACLKGGRSRSTPQKVAYVNGLIKGVYVMPRACASSERRAWWRWCRNGSTPQEIAVLCHLSFHIRVCEASGRLARRYGRYPPLRWSHPIAAGVSMTVCRADGGFIISLGLIFHYCWVQCWRVHADEVDAAIRRLKTERGKSFRSVYCRLYHPQQFVLGCKTVGTDVFLGMWRCRHHTFELVVNYCSLPSLMSLRPRVPLIFIHINKCHQ